MTCKTPEGVVTGNRSDSSHIHRGCARELLIESQQWHHSTLLDDFGFYDVHVAFGEMVSALQVKHGGDKFRKISVLSLQR